CVPACRWWWLSCCCALPAAPKSIEMLTPTPAKQLKRFGVRSTLFGVVTFFTVFAAFPFYWMLITTFKRTSDLYNLKNNPFLFHEPPTLAHLRLLFEETLFPRWLWNTTVAGVLVVGITLVLALPAGYSLAGLAGPRGGR